MLGPRGSGFEGEALLRIDTGVILSTSPVLDVYVLLGRTSEDQLRSHAAAVGHEMWRELAARRESCSGGCAGDARGGSRRHLPMFVQLTERQATLCAFASTCAAAAAAAATMSVSDLCSVCAMKHSGGHCKDRGSTGSPVMLLTLWTQHQMS